MPSVQLWCTWEHSDSRNLFKVFEGLTVFVYYGFQSSSDVLILSCLLLQREPDHEEQPDDNMPPKFKRHLNDDEVTGSIRSERVRRDCRSGDVTAVIAVICSD